MKKFTKIFAVLLCLSLALTVFAACGKEEKKEDDKTTTESTTVETTTEAPKGDATHDGRLIGIWNGEMEYPITTDGKTATAKCVVEFKEDGTMTVTMTREQMKAMYVEMFMAMYGFETVEELDAFMQSASGKTLDEVLEETVNQLDESDLVQTATWETEDNEKLYEMRDDETKDDVTVETYTVSEDGKTVVITVEDEDMGTQTLTLTKA